MLIDATNDLSYSFSSEYSTYQTETSNNEISNIVFIKHLLKNLI